MNYKIIDRDSSFVLDDDNFMNELSQYTGFPVDELSFYASAALEIVEQCLDISLVPNTIEVSLPDNVHTILLPLRQATNVINAVLVDDCNVETNVHPLNLRIAAGKLFLPVNDFSWIIQYQTSPYNLDASTKLAVFKVAEMIINGDSPTASNIRKMLTQYNISVGAATIPH